MPVDLSDHFESKLRLAIDLDYPSLQVVLTEQFAYRRMLAETALKTDYKAHKALFTLCNKQIKKLLAL
jgi:hypothetical protein